MGFDYPQENYEYKYTRANWEYIILTSTNITNLFFTFNNMNRKFTHTVIDITVKIILGGTAMYGVIGGLYFALTRGLTDFGVYLWK